MAALLASVILFPPAIKKPRSETPERGQLATLKRVLSNPSRGRDHRRRDRGPASFPGSPRSWLPSSASTMRWTQHSAARYGLLWSDQSRPPPPDLRRRR